MLQGQMVFTESLISPRRKPKWWAARNRQCALVGLCSLGVRTSSLQDTCELQPSLGWTLTTGDDSSVLRKPHALQFAGSRQISCVIYKPLEIVLVLTCTSFKCLKALNQIAALMLWQTVQDREAISRANLFWCNQ